MIASRLMAFVVILLVGPPPKSAFATDPANYLFAISSQRAEAVIIDTSSEKLVDRILLPNVPSDIAALSRGQYLVVADKKAGQLRIIDATAGRLERSIDVHSNRTSCVQIVQVQCLLHWTMTVGGLL